jgi:glutaconate CoA-transferase subunit A
MDMSKLIDIRKSIENIPDGATIGLGGNTLNRAPMSYCREIARQEKKNLKLVKTAGGQDVDLLCLGGCVTSVDAGFISFETKFGLANNYRRAVQSGVVKANEHACYTVISALRAASMGISFMPVKGLVNSDLIKVNDYFREVECPFTNKKYTTVRAISPDYCILHVHEADENGNARIIGPKYDDITLAKASKKVIIVTERLVHSTYFKNNGEQVDIPHLLVDEVIHSPQGAMPCACHTKYEVQESNMKKYLSIENKDDFVRYLKSFEIKDHSGRSR